MLSLQEYIIANIEITTVGNNITAQKPSPFNKYSSYVYPDIIPVTVPYNNGIKVANGIPVALRPLKKLNVTPVTDSKNILKNIAKFV